MSSQIGVAVDSTADFPEGFIDKYNLNIIPVSVIVDGVDYLDGVDINNDEIINFMKMGCEISTRAPAPATYADYFENLLQQYDYLVSFHVSSELSECFTSADNGLKLLGESAARRIKLIDTRNISIGQSLYALKSINIIKSTGSAVNVEAQLQGIMASSKTSFTVGSLKWLKKSGRIGAAGAMLGSMLNIKPILTVEDAKLALVSKVRGTKAALDEMASSAAETQSRYGGDYDVWVGHCDAVDDAGYLKSKLAAALGMNAQAIATVKAGASVAVKVGPGSCNWGMIPK